MRTNGATYVDLQHTQEGILPRPALQNRAVPLQACRPREQTLGFLFSYRSEKSLLRTGSCAFAFANYRVVLIGSPIEIECSKEGSICTPIS